MTDEHLEELLSIWQQAHKAGRGISADELCRECPEMIPEVARRIEAIRHVERLAQTVQTPVIDQPNASEVETVIPADSKLVLATEPLPQESIGDYELLAEIARGGMGVVYRGRHRKLGRLAAVKMILGAKFVSKEQVARFYTEAEAAAQLDHPGIVPVYEVGEHEGQHFLAMAFVDGQSLWQRVKESPLEPREAAHLMRQVAEAVHHAHSHGIVHRDLKPQNILLAANGQPRVTDFGLAKQMEADSSLTATGQVMGTPSYMPPEQAMGRTDDVGVLSDVYSLGATLYCMLTGRPPFQAAMLTETLRQVCEVDPVAPRLVNRAIPTDLEIICLKCLEKSPAQRYATADALASDLRRFLNGEPITARAVSRGERTWRWCRRHPLVAGLMVMSVMTVVLLVVGGVYRQQSLQWKRTAELQGQLVNQQSMLVKQQKELAERNEQLKNLAQAAEHLSCAGEIASRRKPGWSWLALDEVRAAQQLSGDRLDPSRIRTLLTESLAAKDLRLVAELDPGVFVRDVAFSADSRLLALAQHRGTPTCSIRLFDVERKELERLYSISTVANNAAKFLGALAKGNLNPKFQEGFASVAFSPDGRWLAAGSRQGRLFVWSRESSEANPQTIVVNTDDQGITRLAFSSDSSILLAGSVADKGRLHSFEVNNSWKPWRSWPEVSTEFVIHPNGRQIVTSRHGLGTFDIDSEQRRTDLPEVVSRTVNFTPDGRFLVSGYVGELRVVDSESRQVQQILKPSDSGSVTFAGDSPQVVASRGLLIASASDEQVRVFDLATSRQIAAVSSGGREDPPIAVSPDGRWLAIAGEVSTKLYELRDGSVCSTFLLSKQPLDDIALSSDGKRLVFSSSIVNDERLIRSELGRLELGKSHQVSAWTTRSHLANPRVNSPWMGTRGAITAHPLNDTFAWNCGLLGLQWRDPSGLSHWPAGYLPEGANSQVLESDRLPMTGMTSSISSVEDRSASDGRALRWSCDATESSCELSVPLGNMKTDAALFAIRLRCVPAGNKTPSLRFQLGGTEPFDVPLGDGADYEWQSVGIIPTSKPGDLQNIELQIVAQASQVREVLIDQIALLPCRAYRTTSDWQVFVDGPQAFSPDGRRFWGVVQWDSLICWDSERGQFINRFDNRSMRILDGSSDLRSLVAGNKLLAVGTSSNRVVTFNTDRFPETRATFSGPGGEITALALSPDEELIAAGTISGQLRLSKTHDGATICDLSAHTNRIVSLTFRDQGQQLWTASRDGSVQMWEPQPGGSMNWRLSLMLEDGASPIKAMRLAANGERLAILREGESAAHLWDLTALFRSLSNK